MRTLILSFALVVFALPAARAAEEKKAAGDQSAPSSAQSSESLRQEMEKLKQQLESLQQRIEAQEKAKQQTPPAAQPAPPAQAEVAEDVKDLDKRVSAVEKEQALDRVRFSGDYRYEYHGIRATVPKHFDGMVLQNLLVKTMFSMPILGRPPASVAEIDKTVAANYAQYQLFTNNLTFAQLKSAMGQFPAAMQQQLMGMLMPSTLVNSYDDNNGALQTNRLRLNFSARVSENVSFTGRLSMYKVFGDSTGVQTFNGSPTSMNIDGTTNGVPNSDVLRVDRAYFSWNRIGGSKWYLSIGRRPSTGGPPMNFRQDEERGGTPSAALIDFQFDGITVGYTFNENMIWRLCYGQGFESGFGNGNIMKMPQDRLKDTHFLGANLDLWTTDLTLVQVTIAHASKVTDGFNGLMVLPRNPLTGDAVGAPVVMRYTPSANLGDINLFGFNFTRKAGNADFYASMNASNTRPNGTTTPFGGLMSDPFEAPVNRTGYMGLVGVRFNMPNDNRTKLGFEYNHGSQYWFNFAHAADDIIAPKTNTRGKVFESYLTHRINDRFIFKAAFIRYNYDYSGSGWHVGAPKQLTETPILGFPTYQTVTKFSAGLVARF